MPHYAWIPSACRIGGESHPTARLRTEQVRDIHRLAGTEKISAKRAKELAERFKVCPTQIRNILRGTAWRNVWAEMKAAGI